MKKILFYLFLAALIALAVAYYLYTVERKPSHELVLYGNVDIRQVDLSFRVGGIIQELYVDEGDTVTPGMLLAKLDARPYKDSLLQARGQSAAAKAAYDNAEVLFKRRELLLPSQSVSQEEYDDALSNRNTTKGNLDAALGALALAQTNLRDTEFFAPTEGWVLTRIKEPGAVVEPSQAVLTVSVKSPVWVRAYVNEPNLGLIHFGMRGEVRTDTPGGKTYQGHIGFISPVSEFTPKTVETSELRTDLVYRLRVIIDNPDEGLKQGMPVTVKLHLPHVADHDQY